MGLAGLAYALTSSVWVAIGLIGISGILNAPSYVAGRLINQRNTPREMRGRVFSTGYVLRDIFYLLGMGLAGFADIIDVRLMFAVSSGVLIVVALIGAVLPGIGQPAAEWRRSLALLRGAAAAPSVGAGRPATIDDVQALGRYIPALAGMPQRDRDALITTGRVIEAEPVPPSPVPGRRATARTSSWRAGWWRAGPAERAYQSLSAMGPGDVLGEIAALTGSPRTADVVAAEKSELLQVPAETLKQLMALPQFGPLVLGKMQERLARSASIGDLPRFGRLDQQALREMRAESERGVRARAPRRPDRVHRYNAGPMSPSSLPTVRLYNSLTRRVDPLEPITPGRVTIYTCGSTVYRYAHIGNLRTYLFGDLLRRTLQYLGYEVLYVKNITDVGHMRETGEDPILLAAEVEGKSPEQIAEFYTAAWLEDERLLNMAPADVMPKATDHIPEMVAMTATLIERGPRLRGGRQRLLRRLASFRLRPASGQRLEQMKAGHRVDVESDKRDPGGLRLWKLAEPGRVMKWPSPWGEGFPGWHIECSAMSMKYLGERFDIHTGGIDLKFPHHEDEIAQSEGVTGHPVVSVWLHGEFLTLADAKMAKSAGNVIRVSDLPDKGFEPLAFRYLALTAHYRSKLDFTEEAMHAAASGLRRLRRAAGEADEADADHGRPRHRPGERVSRPLRRCHLRGPGHAGRAGRRPRGGGAEDLEPAQRRALLLDFDRVLGLSLDAPADEPITELPEGAADLLGSARRRRAARDFATSDRLRDELAALGVEVRDTAERPGDDHPPLSKRRERPSGRSLDALGVVSRSRELQERPVVSRHGHAQVGPLHGHRRGAVRLEGRPPDQAEVRLPVLHRDILGRREALLVGCLRVLAARVDTGRVAADRHRDHLDVAEAGDLARRRRGVPGAGERRGADEVGIGHGRDQSRGQNDGDSAVNPIPVFRSIGTILHLRPR